VTQGTTKGVTLPAQVRQWVEDILGDRIVLVRSLHGGMASQVRDVKLRCGQSVVVKMVPPRHGEPVAAQIQEVEAEASVLAYLGGRAWAPALLAQDASGEQSGLPVIVQSRAPGRPDVIGLRRSSWLQGLASVIDALAAVDSAESIEGAHSIEGLPPFSPWFDEELITQRAPRWVTDRGVWRAAIARLDDASSEGEWHGRGGSSALVHRDLHPGNVVFHGGAVAGVVDWSNACIGPRGVDAGRLHIEVGLLAGCEAASELLGLSKTSRSDSAHDPVWDLVALAELAGVLDDFLVFNKLGARLNLGLLGQRADALLRAAVSQA
jgi:aminoglycoside phosphotransferase (APT) family kinase protein